MLIGINPWYYINPGPGPTPEEWWYELPSVWDYYPRYTSNPYVSAFYPTYIIHAEGGYFSDRPIVWSLDPDIVDVYRVTFGYSQCRVDLQIKNDGIFRIAVRYDGVEVIKTAVVTHSFIAYPFDDSDVQHVIDTIANFKKSPINISVAWDTSMQRTISMTGRWGYHTGDGVQEWNQPQDLTVKIQHIFYEDNESYPTTSGEKPLAIISFKSKNNNVLKCVWNSTPPTPGAYTGTSEGGWAASQVRSLLNRDFASALDLEGIPLETVEVKSYDPGGSVSSVVDKFFLPASGEYTTDQTQSSYIKSDFPRLATGAMLNGDTKDHPGAPYWTRTASDYAESGYHFYAVLTNYNYGLRKQLLGRGYAGNPSWQSSGGGGCRIQPLAVL